MSLVYPAFGAKAKLRARRYFALGILLFVAITPFLSSVSHGQAAGPAQRVVEGRILNQDDQPQANAVVYLQDQKSLQVRTFITQEDSRYRFGQLSSEVDYQLWAEFKGHKSKTRSISSFDNKKQFIFDLKIDLTK
jgi:hypothetical protein